MYDLHDPAYATGLAVGILMERHGIPVEEAAAALDQHAAREGLPRLEVAARLTRTPQAPRAAVVPAHLDLSPRELEVLTLIARGATNLQIAETLFLGLNTVKTYIRTAYRKIGTTRRAQAVIWGIEHGLASPTSPTSPARLPGGPSGDA